ncbi:hypothetical protein [Eleftheria terrae]|nr:hypothetical protein [Eleftheria terrae]WKB53616.1 hypothetical protein N7L95_04255 [Eleftheria terrae]
MLSLALRPTSLPPRLRRLPLALGRALLCLAVGYGTLVLLFH